jgi:hypothetical protein
VPSPILAFLPLTPAGLRACAHTATAGYTSPLNAAAAWNLNVPASTSEISTAVHDVACKQNVDLVRNAATLAPAKAEIAADAVGLRRLMASAARGTS